MSNPCKPTPVQPKAASPVGDEALNKIAEELREERNCGFWHQDRGRLFCDDRSMQGDSGHRDVCQCKADVRMISERLALASHPTTGQETVATPRDGGVREALRSATVSLAGAISRLEHARNGGETSGAMFNAVISDYRRALDSARAALSAPGSAGPGERPISEAPTDGTEILGRVGNGWRVVWKIEGGWVYCLTPSFAGWCSPKTFRRLPTLATPSPAQEPGPGDTGALVKAGVEAGIAAAIQGISATAMNMGGDCDRRGFMDPETGEIPCDREEDEGCACSQALEFADRAIKNLRGAYIDKIVARVLATPATTAETRGPAEGAR